MATTGIEARSVLIKHAVGRKAFSVVVQVMPTLVQAQVMKDSERVVGSSRSNLSPGFMPHHDLSSYLKKYRVFAVHNGLFSPYLISNPSSILFHPLAT